MPAVVVFACQKEATIGFRRHTIQRREKKREKSLNEALRPPHVTRKARGTGSGRTRRAWSFCSLANAHA